jgi:hypothetical protein
VLVGIVWLVMTSLAFREGSRHGRLEERVESGAPMTARR